MSRGVVPLLDVLVGSLGATTAAVFVVPDGRLLAYSGQEPSDSALEDAAALVTSGGISVGLSSRRRDRAGHAVAGVPLRAADGSVLGALTVRLPEHPPEALVAALPALAGYVAVLLVPDADGDGAVPDAVAAFALSGAGVLQADPAGVVVAANPAMSSLAGGAPLVGRALVHLVTARERAQVRDVVAALADGRLDTADLALELRTPDGTRAVRASATVERAPDGSPLRLLLVALDDTQARQTAREQAARAQSACALVAAMPDAILVCDRSGTIREVNRQAEVLFGYTPEELVGLPVETLVPVSRAHSHDWLRKRYTAAAHAQPMSTGPGIAARTKGGAEVPVEVSLAAVDLADGPGVVASVRDVTQSRRTLDDLRASHDLIAGILSAATEQAIIATDLDGNVELYSAGAERLLGWSAQEVLGGPAARFDSPAADLSTDWGLDPEAPLEARVRELVGSGVATTHPWIYRTKSGEDRAVLVSVTVRRGPAGPTGLIIVATDRTASIAREAELARSEERFRLAFDNAPVGVALLDARPGAVGRVLRVNRALCEILGFDEVELLGVDLTALVHPESLPDLLDALDILVDGTVSSERLEHRYTSGAGDDVWVQMNLALVRDGDGAPDYLIGQFADITERRRAEAELTHNALHDSLTSLPNRALLTERLDRALARAGRDGTTVAVLYLDLDNFKDVNDSLGHAAGDELLVHIGRRLTTVMRETDTAARLGGDEFVVICEDLTSLEDVGAVTHRITQALAVQVPIAGRMVTVSASIGIAHSTSGHDRSEDLLRAADIAMYRAKANGRSRYEFADPHTQVRAVRQLELESDLRSALDLQSHPSLPPTGQPFRRGDDQLLLDYQPCFDARTGQLVAVEALIRWEHPARGRLSPGDFLDVAEDRDLMVPLGLWVLRAACAQAAGWHRAYGPRCPEIWVNVSSRQLGRHEFSARLADVLAETGLPPEKLCVELTERQALSSAHSTLADLHALPGLGVRLAIDDFGTGYAGLDYLRRLPVSCLKVDASYVASLGVDSTGTAVAAGVVNFGRALDLTVVAEGVETPQQRDMIVDLGADVLQGFLLARPAGPDVVDRLLHDQACVTPPPS
ncbi:diguanylate cyclase/phosphodiesterase with PAS/PAC sensor(s) [Cellulomonas fimi ATCC 484]|uniref:Diguanylate cyclase/phosphodiesterase with PAS/PAC sensor(S) n=1 Tax=Cellulomonas fimi (strain ATCC 484 / DSM 20113 / JCM 1341 / CCUG 24087 / LMG 16345 / NBRC 15513 / NCIMB 8980 / NCTC 7547 / NRS-133) TaxID=590998 RepID=F4H4G5_CELFA|nr:diguanylate cyclase/phosphodiesterase with PAS/PAC sensor(s) [Cellulomonas fimi ATCC 484]VEH36949.1 Cyclic di-GMP phosphodiesterase Gmr [Cellulomonas fimi]